MHLHELINKREIFLYAVPYRRTLQAEDLKRRLKACESGRISHTAARVMSCGTEGRFLQHPG